MLAKRWIKNYRRAVRAGRTPVASLARAVNRVKAIPSEFDTMAREYDKLVRDDIPAVIWESGETPVIHTVSGPEYERRLLDKLEEETAELRDDPSIEELADVLAVVLAIREHWEVGADRLAATRERKAERRGGFERGVVLDRVE